MEEGRGKKRKKRKKKASETKRCKKNNLQAQILSPQLGRRYNFKDLEK
jgi:hypothetical protein